jgi:hypothetical protein
MYIVQVKDLASGTVNNYCARNLTEAKLYQQTTPKFVNIFSAHEFMAKLPKLPIEHKPDKTIEDYLLD